MRHPSGHVLRFAIPGLLLLAVAAGCTCQPGMKAFDVRVQPRLAARGDQPALSSVEVNLVGVSEQDFPRWASYPMNQYWSPSDPLRRAASTAGRIHVMVLSADDSRTKVLSSTDPIWNKWKEQGVMHLVVLAFLPGARSDRPNQDPQRLVLPLDRCRWKDIDSLDVSVEPTGLTTRSVPQAEHQGFGGG